MVLTTAVRCPCRSPSSRRRQSGGSTALCTCMLPFQPSLHRFATLYVISPHFRDCSDLLPQNTTANEALRSSAQDIARLASAEKMALKRIAELETSLEELHRDNTRLKDAVDAADGATQARLHKVSDELRSLQSVHRDCGRQVCTRHQFIPLVLLTTPSA